MALKKTFLFIPAGLILLLLAGCGGGGGRLSARTDSSANPSAATTVATQTTTISMSDCATKTIGITWASPVQGGVNNTLDIDYGGQDIRRQIEVRGLPAGLTGVTVAPFDGITSTASGSTLVATNYTVPMSYTQSAAKLEGGKDEEGGIYYRAWIYFPPWAESLLIPNRLSLYALITYPSGTYKAHCTPERLDIGHTECFGPDYYSAPCQSPPVATATSNPSTGNVPFAVQFTGACTVDMCTYLWNFGDGSPTSALQNPTYIYLRAGTYTATLTVTDSHNFTDTKTLTITAQ